MQSLFTSQWNTPTSLRTKPPGYTHSNSFGFLKRQAWWIIVADGATQSQVILAQQLEFKDKDGNDSNKAVF